MAGYMGFGLQKWIYRQWPKRFFKLDRKPINDSVEAYNTKKWDAKFPPKTDYSRFAKFLRIRSKDESRGNSIMALSAFAIILATVWIIAFTFPKSTFISTKKILREYHRSEKLEAYQYLRNSIIFETEKNNFAAAYDEYVLANKLFPQAIYHQVELANMYVTLCNDKSRYCSETEVFIEKLKNKYCDHKYLSRLKAIE